MTANEELNSLREEIEESRPGFISLPDEELEQVAGGIGSDIISPLSRIENRSNPETNGFLDIPGVSSK